MFHAVVEDGELRPAVGPASEPACALVTDIETFKKLVTGRLDEGARGLLEIEGDRKAFERCRRVFGFS